MRLGARGYLCFVAEASVGHPIRACRSAPCGQGPSTAAHPTRAGGAIQKPRPDELGHCSPHLCGATPVLGSCRNPQVRPGTFWILVAVAYAEFHRPHHLRHALGARCLLHEADHSGQQGFSINHNMLYF